MPSLMTKRDERIDASGSAGRHVAGDERDRCQQGGDRNEGYWVLRLHLEKQVG